MMSDLFDTDGYLGRMFGDLRPKPDGMDDDLHAQLKGLEETRRQWRALMARQGAEA